MTAGAAFLALARCLIAISHRSGPVIMGSYKGNDSGRFVCVWRGLVAWSPLWCGQAARLPYVHGKEVTGITVCARFFIRNHHNFTKSHAELLTISNPSKA